MKRPEQSRSGVIGVVGLGQLGGALATRLRRSGWSLVAYDLNDSAMQQLVDAVGIEPATSVTDVARRADVLVSCLASDSAILQTVAEIEAAGAYPACYVETSTCTPSLVRECAQRLGAHGVAYVDAPVTGGVARALEGSLTMIAAGAEPAVRIARSVLDDLASPIFVVGPSPGQAQLYKLINNLLSAAAMAVTSEAFVLAAKAGLDPDLLLQVLNHGSGRNSATADKFPKAVLPRTFDYGARLEIICKDVSLCLGEAAALGVPMEVAQCVRSVWDSAMAHGGGREDLSTLITHLERRVGVEVIGAAARKKEH